MIESFKLKLLLVALALFAFGVAYTHMPDEKTEAAVTNLGYFNFSYSTVTQRATWEIRLTINDTFTQTYAFTGIGPAGTQLTATSAALNCGALPISTFTNTPINCTQSFPPGGNLLILTLSSPFPQQCTAQNVVIGGYIYQQTTPGFVGVLTVVPGSSASDVGGVQVLNNV